MIDQIEMLMRRGAIQQEWVVAILMDDTATQAALKAEYQSLASEPPAVQSPSQAFLDRQQQKEPAP